MLKVDNFNIEWFLYYLIVINIVSFITMYIDKRKAETHEWRIPEARLFLLAALFGSIGVLAGMKVFRHKTKHTEFVLGIPCIIIIQVIIVYYLYRHL